MINCDSPRQVEKFIFVTHVPCLPCAKRIINLGNVRRVIYRKEYRSIDSIPLLIQAGIEVFSLADGNLTEVRANSQLSLANKRS